MQTAVQFNAISPDRLPAGCRFVRFEYPTSLLVATVRRQSRVYETHHRTERVIRGLGYSLLALILGPWGVPWGLYWTAHALWVNLNGGVDLARDELNEVLRNSGIDGRHSR